MRPNALSLLADKGEGENKRNGASFVKLLARYDETRRRVKVTSIGIQSAGNTSIDAAEGIDHALKVYDYPDDSILLSNHGTDAGGGGTREDLLRKLHSVNRVHNLNEYIFTTCALHGLNLCLSSPATLTIGDGGLLKRNTIQHITYQCNLNLENGLHYGHY